MSRSKRDILETESMLTRLTNLLVQHRKPDASYMDCKPDAESLRRISITLHRWHELECGDSNEWTSWTIARGYKDHDGFHHDEDGRPFLERHTYQNGHGSYTHYEAMPDREAGARKRLAAIVAKYPGLTAYVQTDPRGCALYILPPGALKEGETADMVYNARGIAVHQ